MSKARCCPRSFGHLMSGYAAGYYGYMWSQVLALDMLSAFDGKMLSPDVGRRYRQTILASGGQRPPQALVEAFLRPQADQRCVLCRDHGPPMRMQRVNQLEGKVAIVTGGAGGFGEGIARAYVSEGARVVIARS